MASILLNDPTIVDFQYMSNKRGLRFVPFQAKYADVSPLPSVEHQLVVSQAGKYLVIGHAGVLHARVGTTDDYTMEFVPSRIQWQPKPLFWHQGAVSIFKDNELQSAGRVQLLTAEQSLEYILFGRAATRRARESRVERIMEGYADQAAQHAALRNDAMRSAMVHASEAAERGRSRY